MRHVIVVTAALFLSGCATVAQKAEVKRGPDWKELVARHQAFVKAHLSLPDESLLPVLEGEVIPGMTKDETRSLYGEAASLYVSPTGMMEVWFYENHYVGFDKAGRVVKFGRY